MSVSMVRSVMSLVKDVNFKVMCGSWMLAIGGCHNRVGGRPVNLRPSYQEKRSGCASSDPSAAMVGGAGIGAAGGSGAGAGSGCTRTVGTVGAGGSGSAGLEGT